MQEMDKNLDAAQLDITRHTKAFDAQQAWSAYVLDLLLRHSQATKLATGALLGLRSSAEAADAQAELRAVHKCFQEVHCPLASVMIRLELPAETIPMHVCAITHYDLIAQLACLSKHDDSCHV